MTASGRSTEHCSCLLRASVTVSIISGHSEKSTILLYKDRNHFNQRYSTKERQSFHPNAMCFQTNKGPTVACKLFPQNQLHGHRRKGKRVVFPNTYFQNHMNELWCSLLPCFQTPLLKIINSLTCLSSTMNVQGS